MWCKSCGTSYESKKRMNQHDDSIDELHRRKSREKKRKFINIYSLHGLTTEKFVRIINQGLRGDVELVK